MELNEGGKLVELPKEEYIHVEENGHKITYCTMRKKALHTIGLDSRVGKRLYTRNEKRYYKPYRNNFIGKDKDLDELVKAGYMECLPKTVHGERTCTYWFNRDGLDWLGGQLGLNILTE